VLFGNEGEEVASHWVEFQVSPLHVIGHVGARVRLPGTGGPFPTSPQCHEFDVIAAAGELRLVFGEAIPERHRDDNPGILAFADNVDLPAVQARRGLTFGHNRCGSSGSSTPWGPELGSARESILSGGPVPASFALGNARMWVAIDGDGLYGRVDGAGLYDYGFAAVRASAPADFLDLALLDPVVVNEI